MFEASERICKDASLFQADNNTEARNVPHDGEQQSDCEGDGGHASHGEYIMNNAPDNDNEHDNDSMYTGSSGGSSGNHKKSDCWENCDIYADSTEDNGLLHEIIGHNAPSSLLETGAQSYHIRGYLHYIQTHSLLQPVRFDQRIQYNHPRYLSCIDEESRTHCYFDS